MYSSYSPRVSLKKARDVSVSFLACSTIASMICSDAIGQHGSHLDGKCVDMVAWEAN